MNRATVNKIFQKHPVYVKAGMIAVISIIIFGCVYSKDNGKKLEKDEKGREILRRNESGKDELKNMKVKIDEKQEDISISVSGKKYDEEELKNAFSEAEKEVEQAVLGKNKSLDEVRSDLNLITSVPEKNMKVSWELDRYDVMDIQGHLLIDHAWGRESTTMQDIKSYRPKTNSLSSGQVLECDYTFEKGKLVVKEMADLLCLELVEKGLVTDSITLHVGYSNRLEKKPAHGTIGLRNSTSSARQIIAATEKLYCQIVDPYTSVRRMTVTFNQVVDEQYQQYDLFTDPAELEREHRMQEAILDIKEKFGKNAILKGIDLQAGATTMERNRQIGGHKSGT